MRCTLVLAAVLPLVTLQAQTRTGNAPPAATASPMALRPAPKVLQLEDFAAWKRIGATAISGDGKWMTYTLTQNEGGQPELHIKSLDGGKETTVALGTGGGGGGGGGRGGRGAAAGGGGGGNGPQFSDDSHWVTYFVNPGAGGGRGGRGARGGAPPAPGGRGGRGRGAAAPDAAAQVATTNPGHLIIQNLATGDTVQIPNIGSWRFSPGSKWLAMRVNRPAGATGNGADILLRDMATGAVRNIGNVNQFEFDDEGKILAYTVDAAEKLGNGVYLLDPASGEAHALTTAMADFEALTWSPDGTSLAVLRGDKVPDMKQRANELLTWSGVSVKGGKAFMYDPSKDASFPKGFVLSEFSPPRWAKDGSRVFVGIKEQEAEVAPTDSNKANVDILHWKDQSPQSVQIVQIAQLRRATFPGVIFTGTGKFVRLGDDAMRTVAMAANNNVGVGRNDAAYRGEVAWGGSRADLYKVDVNSGARTLIDKALSRTYGTSPDSKWFLYLKNKQMHAFNLETGVSNTLDASMVAGKTFVNDDDDHAYEKPIWGVGGFAKDGKSVLLYDKYDVWQAPYDGSKSTNLTSGVGRSKEIVFRIVRLGGAGGGGRGGRGGRGGGGAASDSDGVDLTQPITLSAYGDRNKMYGYWRMAPGQAPAPLIWADKNIGGVVKAAEADKVIFTQQDFNEFPDFWTTNTSFASPMKVTDANPILKDFAWASKKVLIDYTTSKGHKLQGTLTLPPDYQPGKKYPMLVEFYEIMSNTHHNFPTPGYGDSPQISMYASNGYMVFQPDIVYEIGKPGTSAVDCITSAVKKVVDLGYADPKHIGLHGHSWGGYQSSYIVTQTDIFAAVVTGAPPTNLISFYDELYKSTGTVQQGITTVGQVRMGADVNPWDNTKMFEEQSPIFHVKNIKTPFMILQGGDDGAVDYVEGLQFFNAARQQGKQVIELSYPGQPHNLTDRDDQKDFAIRMKQFFDHYLMDKPMPQWMADGLPQVKKGGPIR